MVQGESKALSRIEAAVSDFFDGKIKASMRNMTEESCELVYSIPEGLLDRASKKNQMDITEALIHISGVRRVNLVEQKDELSQ